MYLKILYREIHAIWLTLTSRETYLNERSKKNYNFYIQHNNTLRVQKIAKKNLWKKQNKNKNNIKLIFNRWMNCHVYLSASMEKINQEITVVYNQFLYWHKQKKWEALPPRRISKKKIETTNHCQNQPFGTKKSKKKVTHTYTSLSLVSKECKRLLWFPTIVYEVRKINEIKNYTYCCFISIATIHFTSKHPI